MADEKNTSTGPVGTHTLSSIMPPSPLKPPVDDPSPTPVPKPTFVPKKPPVAPVAAQMVSPDAHLQAQVVALKAEANSLKLEHDYLMAALKAEHDHRAALLTIAQEQHKARQKALHEARMKGLPPPDEADMLDVPPTPAHLALMGEIGGLENGNAAVRSDNDVLRKEHAALVASYKWKPGDAICAPVAIGAECPHCGWKHGDKTPHAVA